MKAITTKWPVLLCSVYLFFYCSLSAVAAPNFPQLTGRVIDNANLLNEQEKNILSGKYAQLEDATTAQLVLVTINSLDGYEIADYGYQLGRHWGIGQKDINNGLLIIISKHDRKMRIEVGYGLEGVVTDAIAHNIIHQVMRPEFKKGHFFEGINQASDLLIKAVNDEPLPQRIVKRKKSSSNDSFIMPLIFIAFFLSGIIRHFITSISGRLGLAATGGLIAGFFASSLFIGIFVGFILLLLLFGESNGGSGGGYSSSGGGSFGGGFSGGGGSFGGGGASGGW